LGAFFDEKKEITEEIFSIFIDSKDSFLFLGGFDEELCKLYILNRVVK
jgi:hypothetical protein